MQTSFGMAVMTILGLVFSLGALTTIYSQNTFAQNSNTDSDGGISGAGGAYASANSGAGGASSGTGGYRSNGGFALGWSITQNGAGGGSGGAIIGGGSTGTVKLRPGSKTAVMYSSNHAQLINTMFFFF